MNENEMDDDGLLDDESGSARDTIIYSCGRKDDFASLINASNESDGWVRKYRDYDCYRKMLGPANLHDFVARTKIGDYVGSCICLEFDDHAFVAIYYVRPEFRKKGIGRELFKRVINDDLRKKNIGLHVLQLLVPIYTQLGFSKRTSWLVDNMRLKNVDKTKIKIDDGKLTIKDAREIGLLRIIDYDAKIAKSKREGFVRYWAVDRIDAVCKVIVDSTDEIVGYGCGRLLSIVGNPGFGPIYCNSNDGFRLLFQALISCFDEELKERNLINLHVPTTKSNTVQEILQDAASKSVRCSVHERGAGPRY